VCLPDPQIADRVTAQARRRAAKQPDPRVVDPFHLPYASIPRGIIHDEDLEVLMRLSQNGSERTGDMWFLVVQWDYDTDERR
jgi:hypothetical protein